MYSVNDRQWLLMPSISIVNLRGERNTAISLELIDFQIRCEENLLCDYRKISKTVLIVIDLDFLRVNGRVK